MEIFVINLAASLERKALMERQLSELELPFRFFNAIDGRNERHYFFGNYSEEVNVRLAQPRLSRGELGCWASHFLLWQLCIERNEPICVMEDDIQLGNDFKRAVKICQDLTSKYSYIRLASIWEAPYCLDESYDVFDIRRYLKSVCGTQCYVLTPHAASKFISHAERWIQTVDKYMDRYWVHGVDIIALYPSPIIFADLPSQIERFEKKKSLWKRLVKEVLRAYDKLNCFKYNLDKAMRSKKIIQVKK